MAAACFICPRCRYVDVTQHVVLDAPCAGCGLPGHEMGMVQCVECLDPAVPRSADPDRAGPLSMWVHAIDKGCCPQDVPRKPRVLSMFEVVPLVGMRAIILMGGGLKGSLRGVFGHVSRVSVYNGSPTVRISRDDGGVTNASRRKVNGRWVASGYSFSSSEGSVSFFV